jgi:tungstate transport system ATP-binding protein
VERSARKLSGGEAARVCLARAFVLEPEVMMLDEPFSSLDPPTRLSLLDEVEEILRSTGVTTVMATHDSSEALRLADRIAVMSRGAIVQIGPTARIMTRPVDEFVAQFVGMETILEASVVSRSGRDLLVNVSGRELRARTDVQAGGKVLVCIRPQDVALHSSPPDGINVLGGTIVRVAPMLHHVKVTVDCGFTLCASVVRAPAGVDLAAGTPVTVSIDPSSLHVIGAPHPDA